MVRPGNALGVPCRGNCGRKEWIRAVCKSERDHGEEPDLRCKEGGDEGRYHETEEEESVLGRHDS